MGKLNVLSVKHAKKPGRYHDGNGLMLVVKSETARTWAVRVQVGGRRREFGLGRASELSLSEARERALETRKQFRAGIDPSAARKRSEALKRATPTFREAAVAAHEARKDNWKNRKHRAQWLSSLEAYAFPAIGDIRVDQIEPSAIINLLRPIWLSKPETARRVKQRVSAVLNWSYGQGFRAAEAPQRSIGLGLAGQPKKTSGFAAMPYEDMPALMKKLAASDTVGKLALRFLILTAARSGEVMGATWD